MAIRYAKEQGSRVLAICNTQGSTIPRESDAVIYTHAGPEVAVASTKAFLTQIVAVYLFALYFAQVRGEHQNLAPLIEDVADMPQKVDLVLDTVEPIRELARRYAASNSVLFIGRHVGYPVALEGALKLKEISYIHAEGYPAAEMKHGPIALVDEETPSVFIAPRCQIYPKVMSNLEEVRARRGPVIAIACESDDKIAKLADDVIYVPDVDEYLQPLVTSIPLQLLAYHIAILRGCNVDRPRNLAKSVTVE